MRVGLGIMADSGGTKVIKEDEASSVKSRCIDLCHLENMLYYKKGGRVLKKIRCSMSCEGLFRCRGPTSVLHERCLRQIKNIFRIFSSYQP